MHSPSTVRVRVDGQGRMVLPQWVRRGLLRTPGEVVLHRTRVGRPISNDEVLAALDEDRAAEGRYPLA